MRPSSSAAGAVSVTVGASFWFSSVSRPRQAGSLPLPNPPSMRARASSCRAREAACSDSTWFVASPASSTFICSTDSPATTRPSVFRSMRKSPAGSFSGPGGRPATPMRPSIASSTSSLASSTWANAERALAVSSNLSSVPVSVNDTPGEASRSRRWPSMLRRPPRRLSSSASWRASIDRSRWSEVAPRSPRALSRVEPSCSAALTSLSRSGS